MKIEPRTQKNGVQSFGLHFFSAGEFLEAILAPLGRFGSLFWLQLGPAGVPKSHFSGKNLEKMRSRSRSGKNMKFCLKIDAKMGGPEV